MNYPLDFVAHVKAEWPTWAELHSALDRGDAIAGRYLDDDTTAGISSARIVELLTANQGEILLRQAHDLVRRRKLYVEWSKLYIATLEPVA